MLNRLALVSVLVVCCAVAGCARSEGRGRFAPPDAQLSAIPPQALSQDDLGMVGSALESRAAKAETEMIPVALKMSVAWWPLVTLSAAQTYAIVPAGSIYGPEKKLEPLPAGSQIQVFKRRTYGPFGIPYFHAVRADYDARGDNLIYTRTTRLVWGILWADNVERVAGISAPQDNHRAGLLWGGFGYGHRGDRRVAYFLGFPIPVGKRASANLK